MYMNHDIQSEKLNKLLELVSEWKKNFDEKPNINLVFAVDYAGMLSVNGIVLCPLASVITEEVTYDIDGFSIPTSLGEIYAIGIDWAYDVSSPSVSVITKTFTLYQSTGI